MSSLILEISTHTERRFQLTILEFACVLVGCFLIRSVRENHGESPGSVFPTEHSLRTRTQVRHACTQVHDEKRSSKLAKSISMPFGADMYKPFICHSETRYESEVTDFVASQAMWMHAIAFEAWAAVRF